MTCLKFAFESCLNVVFRQLSCSWWNSLSRDQPFVKLSQVNKRCQRIARTHACNNSFAGFSSRSLGSHRSIDKHVRSKGGRGNKMFSRLRSGQKDVSHKATSGMNIIGVLRFTAEVKVLIMMANSTVSGEWNIQPQLTTAL